MDDLRIAEARFEIGPSRETTVGLVAAAVQLLLQGFDTPSLRILAGEDAADADEVGKYLRSTLVELGLVPLSHEECVLLQATILAEDLLAGRVSAVEVAPYLWALFASEPAAHTFPEEFVKLVSIADGVADIPEYVPESELFAAAEVFVATRR